MLVIWEKVTKVLFKGLEWRQREQTRFRKSLGERVPSRATRWPPAVRGSRERLQARQFEGRSGSGRSGYLWGGRSFGGDGG